MDEGWEHQPHGGPFSVGDLVAKYPWLDAGALEIRRRCIASPIFLACHVLSNKWQKNLFTKPSEGHRLVEQALIAQRDTLWVDSRNTAKTTFAVETGSVWQLLKYPDDSGLLTHSSDFNARGLSQGVRLQFSTNPVLKGIFPEYAMEVGDEGNIKKWSVPCRQRGGQQESIECATHGTATAGRHYDWINASDWMNEQTTPLYGKATFEEMNKVISCFAQVRAMLQQRAVNPRAHWIVDTNRWYLSDLAGTLIENDKGNRIFKVLRGVTGEPGNFVSSWPEWHTPEDIQAIYESAEMNPKTFAANYRSAPTSETGYQFKKEWFHVFGAGTHCAWCDKNHPEPASLRVGILLDPAFSDSKTDSKKTDRSGLVVVGVSPEREVYLLHSAAGRGWDETEIVHNRLAPLVDVYKPAYVGIEDSTGAKAIIRIFNNEMLRTGRFVPYRKIKPAGRSKDGRIAPLHHIAQRWGIFIRPGEHRELIDEACNYGVCQHDDLIDALAYVADDLYGGSSPAAEKAPPPKSVPSGRDDSADGILRRINEREERKNMPAWAKARLRSA